MLLHVHLNSCLPPTMLLILSIVSLLVPLEFGSSLSVYPHEVYDDPVELADEPNLNGVVSRVLDPITDYHSGLYEPFYHIKHQQAASLKRKKGANSQRATRCDGTARIDAFNQRESGSHRSGLLFDEFENAYPCGRRGDLQTEGERSEANKRNGSKKSPKWPEVRGNNTMGGSQRMVGGYNIRAGEFPSLVLLDLATPSENFKCTGVLINENLILTAAHCVTGVESGSITFGAVSWWDHSLGGRTQVRRVYQYCIASDYVPNRWDVNVPGYQDIAVIGFEPEIIYSNWVRPISLDSLSLPNNGRATCMAVGAGITGDHMGHSVVRAMPVEPVRCAPRSGSYLCYWQAGRYSDIATGAPCPGDSGGPLICSHKCPGEQEARQVLQGILSSSQGECEESRRIGLYTNMYRNKRQIDKLIECGLS